MKQTKTVTSVYIGAATKRRLSKLAQDDLRSLSSLIEIILQKYLAQVDASQGKRAA